MKLETEGCPKIQFHNSNLRELSENVINTIPTLKAQEFQKQYGKDTVNLWKHVELTEDTCTFNECRIQIATRLYFGVLKYKPFRDSGTYRNKRG